MNDCLKITFLALFNYDSNTELSCIPPVNGLTLTLFSSFSFFFLKGSSVGISSAGVLSFMSVPPHFMRF